MAATLLFVHGTGVRAMSYAATLATIERQVAEHGLPLAVRGCYWGEAEGARLRAGGASIPGYAEAGGREPSDADQILALWTVLYSDPWYELRLLRHRPTIGITKFGEEPPATRLMQAVGAFKPSDALREQFANNGLGEYLDSALADLRRAPELSDAAATAPSDPIEHRRAIARAVVAAALTAAEDAGRPAVDGAIRDALVLALTSELQGDGLGIGDFLLRPVKGLALRLVTRKLTGDRGSLSDAAAPTAGDVLRFLANGAGARTFLANAIGDLPGPVYLLAHSLGGIMCADLLVRGDVTVAGLVTVGSQTPFLYEIGAFPALVHPAPLPEHMPPWLNVYDRRDLLSYVGEGVFPGRVRDVLVDNGQPFHHSHSAYWTNPATWAALREFIA